MTMRHKICRLVCDDWNSFVQSSFISLVNVGISSGWSFTIIYFLFIAIMLSNISYFFPGWFVTWYLRLASGTIIFFRLNWYVFHSINVIISYDVPVWLSAFVYIIKIIIFSFLLSSLFSLSNCIGWPSTMTPTANLGSLVRNGKI